MGARTDVVEAYKTVVPRSSHNKLRAALKDAKRRPHVVAFTSSSTVRNFMLLVGGSPASTAAGTGQHQASLDGIHFASIGPITSATLRNVGLPVHIQASEYTVEGLTQAIVHWAKTSPGRAETKGGSDASINNEQLRHSLTGRVRRSSPPD
jgi:uroporphyrinogen III methyltransferase/synthase